jgi:nucleotide-binding universal stress UspA family protein
MFKTIVVGTDGSDTAARAVRIAGELAAASNDAVLHIVSVDKGVSRTAVALAETSPTGTTITGALSEDDAVKGRENVLKRAADSVSRTALHIETHARIGSPAEVLCEVAEQVHADLIVVGNRGMQGGRRVLGSVPNSVSHHAPCSLLIADTG